MHDFQTPERMHAYNTEVLAATKTRLQLLAASFTSESHRTVSQNFPATEKRFVPQVGIGSSKV